MGVPLVVVGAHPMDAEILGGAIAALLADHRQTSVLVHLTNGAGSYPHLGRDASADRSRREADEAARLLGTTHHWCNFESRALSSVGRFRERLVEHLADWKPDVVITHWRGSWHQRHRIAHRLVLNALTTAGLSPNVYFAENFEDLMGFTPTCYVDISRSCERWWEALTSYRLVRDSVVISRGDMQTFPYYAYYHAIPRVRGLESRLPLAQALVLRGARRQKPVVVDDVLDGCI